MGTAHPELEMTIGPIPLADGVGKEVVVRYSTGLASGGKWLTDSNGRELLERTRDERPDYSLNLTEPQAANMHPIQTAIAVRQHGGGGAKLTVTPDRSQAGTSLVDGQLELLVHRRLLVDDGEGAGEPLNETESYHYTGTTIHRTGRGLMIRARHWLTVDAADSTSGDLAARQLAERVFAPPLVAFAASAGVLANSGGQMFVGTASLPSAVSLLTVEPQADGAAFVRLAHKFGAHEAAGSATSSVKVSLATLFHTKATHAEE